MKKLSIILLLALLLINIQCGGGGDRTHSGTTPVSIKVTAVTGETGSGAVGLSGAVKTTDLASAVADGDGDGEGRQLSMCRITITGPGMADMVREVDIAGKSSIRETFNVPSGLNRSFLIQMFIENNDTVIVQAKSDGKNLEGKYMEILMKPTRQDDYFEAPEFSGILSVINAETRSVMLNWKPATDNITDQKRMQYLIYLTTQSKRDQNTNDIFKAYEMGKGTIREEDPLLKYYYVNDEQFISYEYVGAIPEDENTLSGAVSHRLKTGVPYFFMVRASDEWGFKEDNLVESEQIVVYMLDVDVQGRGMVTSEPKGIDCGTKCSEDFLSKPEIKLTAKADDGSVFNGWKGNDKCVGVEDCKLTLSNNESVTATFSIIGSCTNGEGEPANEGQSCDDGQFCTEGETCQNGTCTGGITRTCSDGVGCTDDSCDDINDTCLNTPNNGNCQNNGQFCDGTEICDPLNDCLTDGDPCLEGETCDEAQDTCIPPVQCGNGTLDEGEECDDGQANGTTVCGCQTNCTYTPASTPCLDNEFCNGDEICDGAGTCQPGIPVDCSDDVGCTDDLCDEINDTCLNTPNNGNCQDNGQYCDGTESCDPVHDCLSSGDPCQQGETCDEEQNKCIPPVLCGNGTVEQGEECDDGTANGTSVCGCQINCAYTPENTSCADGAFCNGEETCNGAGTCRTGTPPCPAGATCNESLDSCPVDCTDNDNDGYSIEGGDTCGPVDCDDNDGNNHPGNTEVCDDQDNDCDDKVDESFGDKGDSCTVGEGECKRTGSMVCNASGTGTTCDATPGSSSEEICDGKDNDCDGDTDENGKALCDNGEYCDGQETCAGKDGCIEGNQIDCSDWGDQCNSGKCDENSDKCKAVPVNEGKSCNDSKWCNIGESCQSGVCTGGSARNCSDDVGCTDDACNENTDECVRTPNNANCPDNEQFCDGAEFCDPSNDCSSSGNPCPQGETCNESADTCQGLQAPTLLSPSNNAVLDNNCEDRSDSIVWDFDWSSVTGAIAYQIYVIGDNADTPIIDTTVKSSSYHFSDPDGYIINSNRFNWTWKVRARNSAGQWSAWSSVRSFDVEPLNTDCQSNYDIVGYWTWYYEMNKIQKACGNNYSNTWLQINADHTWTNGNKHTGTWKLTGNKITITYPKGEYFSGTVNSAGTIISDGSIYLSDDIYNGCWEAKRVVLL